MKNTPTPNSRRGQRGFTLVELLVVISIIVVLASIATPTVLRAMKHAERVEALANLRSIKGGLDLFAADFSGELPNDSTAEQLANLLRDDEPDSPRRSRLEGSSNLQINQLSGKSRSSEVQRTSNDYLQQLMGRGLDNEKLLHNNAFRSTFRLQRPNNDGVVDEGENVWGYTRNLFRTSSGHIPVVYDAPVSTGESPRFSKKTWDGRILVAKMDGSTTSIPISGSDRRNGPVRETIRGQNINLFSQEALEEGEIVPANLKRIGSDQ